MDAHDAPSLGEDRGGAAGAAEAPWGRLTILSGAGLGRRYTCKDRLVLGRARGCDVVLEDREASREHARVERDETGRFALVDLGSRNGTLVNSAEVKRTPLAFGDRIRIGKVTLLFSRHDEVEDQLLERQRFETLGRLTAGIAHDLNNALSVVLTGVGYLSDMPEDSRDPAEGDECLQDIQVATDRAGALAHRLLSFVRGEGAERERVDVSLLTKEVVHFVRRAFPRTIALQSAVEPSLWVYADACQMHQVLMNLCVNARDAILSAGGTGKIIVQASEAPQPNGGRRVTLVVSDDGCGMDATTRERVFEPFFTTKTGAGGFGVGLSTVAEIVAHHTGRIEVESEVGAGSVFKVHLPACAPPVESSAAHAAAPPVQDGVVNVGGGRVVLVVDDEEAVRRSLARVLERAGFRVLLADNGDEAVALVSSLEASPPDLVLLDLDMPMPGEDALVQMRQIVPSISVLCISGHGVAARLTALRAAGARGFLPKPCSSQELLLRVCEVLEPGLWSGWDEETGVTPVPE